MGQRFDRELLALLRDETPKKLRNRAGVSKEESTAKNLSYSFVMAE
jgi:hypothetical protein